MKRWRLLTIVLAFELGLVGIGALIMGWQGNENRPGLTSPSGLGIDLGRGLLASLPLLAAFLLIERIPLRPFQRLVTLMQETVAPIFQNCSLAELAIVSLAAGVGEEVLFRGALQAGLASVIPGSAGTIVAVACASALFGVLHWITPTYALCAALAGAYLGTALVLTNSLCVPIVAHAAYDFAALTLLVRRPSEKSGSSLSKEPPDDAQ